MRKCPNCGRAMTEGYKIKLDNPALMAAICIEKPGFSDKPEAAVCSNCGEVSLYFPNIKLKK